LLGKRCRDPLPINPLGLCTVVMLLLQEVIGGGFVDGWPNEDLQVLGAVLGAMHALRARWHFRSGERPAENGSKQCSKERMKDALLGFALEWRQRTEQQFFLLPLLSNAPHCTCAHQTATPR
jgi:hypothetical protein